MIIDLQRFIAEEKQYWASLEKMLDKIEKEPEYRLSLEEAKRFQYLYQRTSADLAKAATFASDPDTHRYLESIVAKAYGEIQETREKQARFSPLQWFFITFPRTFRNHIKAFLFSILVTVVGFVFGGAAVSLDPDAKQMIIPFSNLQESPSERVAREEKSVDDRLKGIKITGASAYMTHNTRVGLLTMALGISWGIGTLVMLFYNGVVLGAVAFDYVLAGQSTFLIAWLSPHGVIEIPAIILAGQAGLVLAGALIGRGDRLSLRARLRALSGDIVTLCFGVALMLTWAGFVESFISQYHEPVLPYSLKISFALVELLVLILFLVASGRQDGGRG